MTHHAIAGHLSFDHKEKISKEKGKRIPPPDPPRHLYLFEVQLIYPPLM
jgi:hypothetical protein